MKTALWAFAMFSSLIVTAAAADEGEHSTEPTSPATPTPWEFAITAYPTFVRGGDNYIYAVAAADRDALHLEARYNYEADGARSAFVGWTLHGGEKISWELTPLLGGAWGTIQAFVPGVEASAAWTRLDFYIEAEYVHDSNAQTGSYLYAWSELAVRPLEYLRIGLATQRTRAYGGERDIQRGPFAQLTWGHFTVGAYWFNAGSSDQVVLGSIGATF